jgi:hypothetical protein
MLPKVYTTVRGVLIPTNDLMNNLLVDYIKQYELGLNQTMLDGDITEEYAYYFERLKEISILYPNFDYQRHLDKECSNAIIFTLIQLKTLRLGSKENTTNIRFL